MTAPTDPAVPKRHFAYYPIRDVETIAVRLEDLARRMRQIAESFADPKQKTDSVLGDVISTYLQFTGNNATFIENLIRDVEHLRKSREDGAR